MTRRLNLEWADLEENPDTLDRFFVMHRYIERNEHVWISTFVFDEIQSTAYRNSTIHVKLVFPSEYPFKTPKIYFKTPVNHPYVDESSGELCSCILEQLFRNSDMATVKTRDILEYLYLIIISDGSLLDNEKICIHRGIQDIRDNNYLLFDSIIQRIMGNDLPEDTEIDDIIDTNYSQTKEWDVEVNIQRSYNAIRRVILTRLFNGKFEGIRVVLNRFLGLEKGIKFKDNPKLFEEYIFPVSKLKEGSIVVATTSIVENEEGQLVQKTVAIPKWSCLTILDGFEHDDVFTIPFSSEVLNIVIGMCGAKKEISFRMYNPTSIMPPIEEYSTDKEGLKHLIEPWSHYDLNQTFEIIKAADFLGAERITIIGCLHLSYLIKRKSRDIRARTDAVKKATANRKRKRRALFKTHVLKL
tara:strand:- start:51 stop:1289 length:1239 start_codon:yes stop_codon:yes gene_type:complete